MKTYRERAVARLQAQAAVSSADRKRRWNEAVDLIKDGVKRNQQAAEDLSKAAGNLYGLGFGSLVEDLKKHTDYLKQQQEQLNSLLAAVSELDINDSQAQDHHFVSTNGEPAPVEEEVAEDEPAIEDHVQEKLSDVASVRQRALARLTAKSN